MIERPNILFILTDNQRADLLGCAGNSIIQTPNLDRLAEGGIRFSNAFATTPSCAASRASYLTGMYERRHQFTFYAPPLKTKFSNNSYPALLKSSGYSTGFIGKFGVAANGIEPSLEDAGGIDRMFDHFDNFEHWTDEGYEIRQPDGSVKHLTDITGDKVIDFLDRHTTERSGQPFCLSVSFNAPHAQDGDPRTYIWPKAEDALYGDAVIPEADNADPEFFESLPRFIRESESRTRWHTRYDTPDNFQRNMKGLYRMVSGIDRNVGRMMESLERHSLSNNTVIIFASDHGMYYGERGLSDCWQLNEESIRIPLIVYDPRRGVAGTVKEELVLNIDVAPTILDLAGVSIPSIVQGHSLIPLLKDAADSWRTEFFCEHLFRIPKIDIPKSEGVRTERWKYIRYFEQNPVHEELYDLEADFRESHNLAGETEYAHRVGEMRLKCSAHSSMHGAKEPQGASHNTLATGKR